MDGVLADVYRHFILLERERYGIVIDPGRIEGVSEEEAFPHFTRIVNSGGFFRHAPVMAGAVEGLRRLEALYDVRVVSSATEFPASLREKYDWLREHFPFISWRRMTFGGSKDLICGDIMIDDHTFNLREFHGRKIIFTQPHNINIQEPGIERAGSWPEVTDLLGC